jgi:hypothetical protein
VSEKKEFVELEGNGYDGFCVRLSNGEVISGNVEDCVVDLRYAHRKALEDFRERLISACKDEKVYADETKQLEDYAYNNACEDCADTIRRMEV